MATIAASDILRSEAAMMIPALRQAALRPATDDEIKMIVGSRFATYPQPQRDEGEAAAFWADYFSALEGLTAAAIEAGMAAHVRGKDSEFLPKPGRLADLARTQATGGRWTRAHARARSAVEKSREAQQPKPETPRPNREEVEAIMTEFRAKMEAKAMVHTPKAAAIKHRPPPSARVDARGMSAEMRALFARNGDPTGPDLTANTQTGEAA